MSNGNSEHEKPRLIADIGGTNARFALISGEDDKHLAERVLPCADFVNPVAAVERYLEQSGIASRPVEAAFAVATPITGDRVKMTNHVWSFSIEETRKQMGLERLIVINDFTALAMALPYLQAADLHKVGPGDPVVGAPVALLGPGTGLGVSGLVPSGKRWIPLQTEGGHVTFSPADDREVEILRIVRRNFDHVSAERLISGQGMMNLYHALAEIEGKQAEPLTPPDITQRCLAGSCPLCVDVMKTLCGMLGTVAGNLALSLGARAGVYIGGGIVPRLGDFFENTSFRYWFERKGRFSDYTAAIPTYVIRAKHPAFVGVSKAFGAFE
jgi:glucokinase